MSDITLSAESRLNNLIERLLATADAAAVAGDWGQVRAVAEDVLTVEPEQPQALQLVARADASLVAPAAQRAFMTVVFADLVDSTPLADRAEPEVVRDIFEIYREAAAAAFARYEGTIENFLGDGIIAKFGWPESHEDDARRAVLASLDLLEGMREADRVARQRHGVPAQARIGVHTGQVVVADIGSGAAIEREAIVGVVPNLAARIQSEATPGTVIVSDVTHQLIEGEFAATSLGLRPLKGISRPVELFAIDQRHGIDVRLGSERFARSGLIARSNARERLRTSALAPSVPEGSAPAMTVIEGDAGMGKSRLVAALREDAIDAGMEITDFECLPYHTNSPLWTVRESLGRAIGYGDHLSADEKVERVASLVERIGGEGSVAVPLLAALLDFDPGPQYPAPELDAPAARQLTLATLQAWLSSSLSDKGRLVIFEDLHWADASTLELVRNLAGASAEGTQVLATMRTGQDGAPAVAWAPTVSIETLGPLDEVAAAQLVEALVAQDAGRDGHRTELSSDEIAGIVARAEGVPLFLHELTLASLASDANAEFPARLQEILAARLTSPGVDLELLQAAATIGPVLAFDLLAQLTSIDESSERFGILLERGLLEPVNDGRGTHYRFAHALLCSAAYETQVLDRRRERHNALADALLASGGDAALIAHHLEFGGTAAAASAQYLVASQAAQARGANEEALQLATRGLELTGTLGDGPQRDLGELSLRMLRTLAVSSIYGYAAPTVEPDIRRSVEIADQYGTGPDFFPAVVGLWSWMFTNGQLREAGELLQRARVGMGEGAELEAECAACEGWQLLYEGKIAASKERFEVAKSYFAERDASAKVSPLWTVPNDPVAISAIGLACAELLSGDLPRARALVSEATQRAQSEPFPRGPFSACFVGVYHAWMLQRLGDDAEMQREGERISAIGAEHGYVYWMSLAGVYLAERDPARLQSTMDLLETIGHRAFVSSYHALVADAHESIGDYEAACASVEAGLQEIEETGERVHEPMLLRQRAEVCFREDPDQAVAALQASISTAQRQGNVFDELLSANVLAQLPESHRPADWSTVLDAAAQKFAPDVDWPPLAEALARTGTDR